MRANGKKREGAVIRKGLTEAVPDLKADVAVVNWLAS